MCPVGKSYNSVAEMLTDAFPDESRETLAMFGRKCEEQRISQVLFLMRTEQGITREEMAAKLGVSAGAIARMEDEGGQVKYNDIIAYVRALGFNPTMQFTSYTMNRAGLIRYHLEGVAKAMSELRDISSGDDEISSGVVEHFCASLDEMLHKVVPKWQDQIEKMAAEAKTKEYVPGFHLDIQDESFVAPKNN